MAQYVYGPLGRCIQKTKHVLSNGSYSQGGVKYNYIYDGNRVIAELSSTGNFLAEYLYGNDLDELISIVSSNRDSYYIQDHLNSVRYILNNYGVITEIYHYDNYGNVKITDSFDKIREHSFLGNKYMFCGRRFDKAIMLYNYRTRHFNPQLGRFMQLDPAGLSGGDINFYRYANNNPVKYNDPLGLCKEDDNNPSDENIPPVEPDSDDWDLGPPDLDGPKDLDDLFDIDQFLKDFFGLENINVTDLGFLKEGSYTSLEDLNYALAEIGYYPWAPAIPALSDYFIWAGKKLLLLAKGLISAPVAGFGTFIMVSWPKPLDDPEINLDSPPWGDLFNPPTVPMLPAPTNPPPSGGDDQTPKPIPPTIDPDKLGYDSDSDVDYSDWDNNLGKKIIIDPDGDGRISFPSRGGRAGGAQMLFTINKYKGTVSIRSRSNNTGVPNFTGYAIHKINYLEGRRFTYYDRLSSVDYVVFKHYYNQNPDASIARIRTSNVPGYNTYVDPVNEFLYWCPIGESLHPIVPKGVLPAWGGYKAP